MEHITESTGVIKSSSKPEVIVSMFVQGIFNKVVLLGLQGVFVGNGRRMHTSCYRSDILIGQQAKMFLPELSAESDGKTAGIPL
jgi:hypothetical protein